MFVGKPVFPVWQSALGWDSSGRSRPFSNCFKHPSSPPGTTKATSPTAPTQGLGGAHFFFGVFGIVVAWVGGVCGGGGAADGGGGAWGAGAHGGAWLCLHVAVSGCMGAAASGLSKSAQESPALGLFAVQLA